MLIYLTSSELVEAKFQEKHVETQSKEQCNVTKFSSIGNGIFICKTTRFFGAWCEKVLYKTSDQSSAAMVSPTGQGGLRNFC